MYHRQSGQNSKKEGLCPDSPSTAQNERYAEYMRGRWYMPCLRLRTPHRSTVGPAHPSRSHPGDEWRQLPPQAKPPQTGTAPRHLTATHPAPRTRRGAEGPLPLRSRAPSVPQIPALTLTLLAYYYSVTLAYFHSGLDKYRFLPGVAK